VPHLRNKNKAALLNRFLQTNLFQEVTHKLLLIGWAWGVGSGTLRFEQLREKPATAIWGMRDPTLMANHLLPLFQESFPSAPISRLTQASHYLYEDAPEAVGLLIRQFIVLTRAI
jgi:cis-3-alkyl-4-acyloxetan-2-one decarboxylase